MSKKTSPVFVGIFTLIGLLLGAGALVLFGAGKFFEKTSGIALYFDKSANGLLVGSEVRFGGVRIGRVSSIRVLIDPKGNRKIIPVMLELSQRDLAAIGSTSGTGIDFASEAGVAKAVREGLRARMKQQSLLTGQLYIEFDIVPGEPALVYQPDVDPGFPTVPTIGTEMDELISGVADGLRKFNSLDLGGVMKDLRDVLANTKTQIAALNLKEINDNVVGITADVRGFIGSEKLANAIERMDEALVSIDALAKKADRGFDPLLEDLEKVVQQANVSLAKIEEASAEISKVTNPRAPTLLRLQTALDEVERSSRAIKELAADLKRNPNAVLLGKDHQP